VGSYAINPYLIDLRLFYFCYFVPIILDRIKRQNADEGMVTIVDPANDKRIFAVLRRNFTPTVRDHWQGQIFFPTAVKNPIMLIFAAFVVDHQKYFKPNN
jgi:hypothetical protein